MRRLFVSTAAALLAAPAFADDLTPPSWRFSPGSTVQHWDFSAGPAGGAPDALPLNNPYGTPILTPIGASTWFPAANGRSDIWDISGGGFLSFRVPNTGNQAQQKNLWLQVTFFSIAALPPPTYTLVSPAGAFTLVSSQVTPLANGWYHELTQWNTPSCPPFETIQIMPGQAGAITLIDQVVIDTQCIPVPGPSAAAPLALAGLAAFRRRRC